MLPIEGADDLILAGIEESGIEQVPALTAHERLIVGPRLRQQDSCRSALGTRRQTASVGCVHLFELLGGDDNDTPRSVGFQFKMSRTIDQYLGLSIVRPRRLLELDFV